MTRWLFSAFWGLLATSALSQAIQNASQGLWTAVFWGSLVTLWTGANSYLWAMKPLGAAHKRKSTDVA